MHTFEDTGLYLAVPLGELTLWHAVFVVVLFVVHYLTAFLVFLAPDVDIFGANHHIHGVVLAEAGVDTVELLSAELHTFVAYHRTAKDVTLADEVGYETVLRLVVDVGRRTYLLYLTFAHHDHAVAQRQCLLLVVGDVDKGDTQFLVQLFELNLHVVSHLQVERRQRFVQ